MRDVLGAYNDLTAALTDKDAEPRPPDLLAPSRTRSNMVGADTEVRDDAAMERAIPR